MRIRVVAVGKLKEAHYRDAVDEYLGRLKRYATIEEVEIKEGPQVAQAMRKAIPPRAHVVALTIDGKMRSSEELAARLEDLAGRTPEVVFVIGGADGIPAEIVKTANETLSLGKMTLPHRLARLVLVEQVYRAMTIRKGEPYHHG
ncbi:MAG: 23S rRNA (pseudouridine(1915)-N(3))-methyltransferase RlmH [Deltaproteobacteria bacterium]|nr:23S rRNA (pseudouridine(1915)-N(3))-methyltransferase RlmH [Deltaproteobacteria bacterium]